MDAATIIESESRELIRRRGLDVHADQLEPLIREVVTDYDRRSSSGEVPVLRADDDTMVAEIAARIGGFGPLQEMLDDPSIEEIWLNSPPKIIDAPLPEGVLGYTDGVARIWLDDQLTAVDRRVVLDHELIHYVRGHRGARVCPHRAVGDGAGALFREPDRALRERSLSL